MSAVFYKVHHNYIVESSAVSLSIGKVPQVQWISPSLAPSGVLLGLESALNWSFQGLPVCAAALAQFERAGLSPNGECSEATESLLAETQLLSPSPHLEEEEQ